MTASFPRLRSDLAFCRQATAEGAVYVVKDPVRGDFYRFGEAERFITEQLNGATPVDEVRRRAEERFGTALEPGILKGFLGRLDRAGLLETEEQKRKQAAYTSRRVNGSLLYLRFKLFDPNRLFDRLVGRIQFFFTPQFVVLSAISILAAGWLIVAGWDDVTQNVSRVYRLSSIPVVVLVAFLVIGAHEFAHGLTCKHFGGEVHEIGFFLIYFQPALYCNVSDAWLFPEKAKRLWVGFAGPYFELFLWSLATFAWRLTELDTWINYVSFIVMTTSGVSTLLNFNPLIKLDGYYLMSDWLEIPNLRRRAFASVGQRIRHPFTGGEPVAQMTRRQRRICMAYGLVAAIGSASLLGYAFVKFGSYLAEQRQPLSLALVASLLVIKVRSRIRRFFGKSAPDEDEDPDQPETSSPASDVPEPPAPRKTKKRRKLERFLVRGVVVCLVAAATMAFLVYRHVELRVGGPLNLLPVHNADVRVQAEGIIEEIYVDEGQTVQRGDLIARLFERDAQAELQKTVAAIEEAQAKLRLLVAGPRLEEIQQARIEDAKDAEAITYATSRLARYKALYEDKLLSKQELEDNEALLVLRKSEQAAAKSRLALLLAGSRPEEIEAMKAAVTNLETQRRYLEEQLRLMRVVSPASGIVATPSRELKEMRYHLVKKGDLIAKVFDLKTITAEIAISEKEIADVKLGQPVRIKVRAYPEQTFMGKVTSVATAAQFNDGSAAGSLTGGATSSSRSSVSARTVLITSEIDNSSLLLKPEMTGQAKISCGQRRLLDLVVRRIARTLKVQFWSWW